jgi:hypothetical protein
MTEGTEPEILLQGGEINDVVRVGDTVRRAWRPSTPTIHALLDHVRTAGFTEAPEPLGRDDQGREILRYIEGEVISGARSVPDFVWSDATLIEVARLLRRLHEATATFEPPEGARWWWPVNERPGRRVICHNDVAPWNVVFRDEKPVGLIDWDLAAPGPASSDIARALWFFVPLTAETNPAASGLQMSIEERARRIRVFCDAYGVEDRSEVLDWVRQEELDVLRGIERLAAEAPNGFRGLWERPEWHDTMRRDREFLEEHLTALRAAL